MDEIKNDADALGESFVALLSIIVIVICVALVIYFIVSCVNSRRKKRLVAVIHGKGDLVLADYARRTETEMNFNHSLDHEFSSQSSNTD